MKMRGERNSRTAETCLCLTSRFPPQTCVVGRYTTLAVVVCCGRRFVGGVALRMRPVTKLQARPFIYVSLSLFYFSAEYTGCGGDIMYIRIHLWTQ